MFIAKNCSKLRGLLTSKLTNVNVLARAKDEKIIFITGMDAVTTTEEVSTEIRERLGTGVDFKLQSMRLGFGGSRRTEVALRAASAETLLQKGLKIAFSECHLRMRLKLDSCTKCLLWGHWTKNCTNEGRRDLCAKCGSKEHVASKCTEQGKCFSCDTTSHGTNMTACPVFRRLLRNKRERRVSRNAIGNG